MSQKKEYALCPECGKKVIKEYPRAFHAKCFDKFAKNALANEERGTACTTTSASQPAPPKSTPTK